MEWTSSKKWEELKMGIDCPMCSDIYEDENRFSFKVAELKQSFVRLPKNQYYKGYIILFFKKHANELFELSPSELSEFWEDVSRVAKALNTIYKPLKINYLIFGHHCPHLHCHLVMHFPGEDPNKPVKMDEKEVFLTNEEYRKIIQKLKEEI
jgi:diadenosine tetraphosphate (Ap4A) HIT family hydrolase